MKHYHDYKCDVCTPEHLPKFLNDISKSGYKLISVTAVLYGCSEHYTLVYDRRPEEEK